MTTLQTINRLALDLIEAEEGVEHHRIRYSNALEHHFDAYGRPAGRMTADAPEFDHARRATQIQYDELQRAKRQKYRAMGKLRAAVRARRESAQ